MRLPVIKGTIKRRLLVNFRADPAVVQRLLPPRFRPKLHRGFSLVGICLIRLEDIRAAGLPRWLGFSSENAAHRIAVEWDEGGTMREGVFIPRRDTDAWLNRLAGGRIFPGEHHAARFSVSDVDGHIDFTMEAHDHSVAVRVVADAAAALPRSSCFQSLAEASAYFETGSVGYSVTRDTARLDGLRLRTQEWRVHALTVHEVRSTFFSDTTRFPAGAIEFDHALVMRDVVHEWHHERDFQLGEISSAKT